MKELDFLILFILSLIVGACILAVCLYNKKYRHFVLCHSLSLRALNGLNSRSSFKGVSSFDMKHSYDNENFYNDISPLDYLIYNLQFKKNSVKQAMEDAASNRVLFSVYTEEISKLQQFGRFDTDKLLKNTKKLIAVEKKAFNEAILKPTLDLKINVCLYLTNIKGDHKTKKQRTFDEAEIKGSLALLQQRANSFYLNEDVWKAICRVERGKVSNKMRFAVYKRDNYRCKICGRKTDALEVDHIFPISKGGKTTFDNLQTLCHKCNAEKSDKVAAGAKEPKGIRSGVVCEVCGAPMLLKKGKYGSFYGCANYPKCKFTKRV